MPKATSTTTTAVPANTPGLLSASRRRLLAGSGLAATMTAIGLSSAPGRAAAAPAPVQDALLLRLGRAFHEACAREAAAWKAAAVEGDVEGPLGIAADRLNKGMNPLLTQIEKARATTLPGLLVKIRAVRYCRSGDDAGPEIFGYHPFRDDKPATDERLILSLLADLHALEQEPGA